jgi:hypothetical protein
MLLMRANPLLRPLEGVGPEIKTFLGPEMATSEASVIWAQKAEISGPTPSNGPCNGYCAHSKSLCPAPVSHLRN